LIAVSSQEFNTAGKSNETEEETVPDYVTYYRPKLVIFKELYVNTITFGFITKVSPLRIRAREPDGFVEKYVIY